MLGYCNYVILPDNYPIVNPITYLTIICTLFIWNYSIWNYLSENYFEFNYLEFHHLESYLAGNPVDFSTNSLNYCGTSYLTPQKAGFHQGKTLLRKLHKLLIGEPLR